jgi:hypothetical protein
MRKPFLMSCSILLLALLALSCGGPSDEGSEEPDEAEEAEGADEGSAGGVPRPVLSIESDAEDAIDMVFAGKWDRVAADADSIASSWTEFVGSSEGSAVTDEHRREMDEATADLKAAAQAEDELAARQAANDVSKVIVDVFDLFDFKIPSDVGRLDWLERQVIIDADRDDWDAVAGDVVQTRETFDRVKPGVVAAGGEEEALDCETSVAKQGELAASRDPAIVDEANIALELVDDLESVY